MTCGPTMEQHCTTLGNAGVIKHLIKRHPKVGDYCFFQRGNFIFRWHQQIYTIPKYEEHFKIKNDADLDQNESSLAYIGFVQRLDEEDESMEVWWLHGTWTGIAFWISFSKFNFTFFPALIFTMMMFTAVFVFQVSRTKVTWRRSQAKQKERGDLHQNVMSKELIT